MILFFAPAYFAHPKDEILKQDSSLQIAMAEIDSTYPQKTKPGFPNFKFPPKSYGAGERFYFDPNTIGISDWTRMGVKEKTAKTITRFREKGGKFRTAADLDKIYGMSPALAQQIKPFVRFTAKDSATRKNFHPIKKKLPASIPINTADSLAWESLPGIGPKLAGRIINFRNRLGGFYAIGQVAEVYGLQDSVFRKIETFLEKDEQPLHLLGINSATLEELSAHPYISRSIANAIVQYRIAHGRFQQLDELAKIHLITSEQYAKISHYCKLD
jgi:DNA uptake protein ComE-like DNA-binding protein